MVHLGEVSPPIWDVVIEEMTEKIDDFEEQDLLDTIENWRKYTNRRKFDRELFEKYGFMKDLILDSRFQMVKHYLEEHANFDFIVGDPLLPISTAVIILFMLHKRVKNDVLVLASFFVFSINPIYVCILAFIFWLFFTSKSKPKQHKPIKLTTDKLNSSSSRQVRVLSSEEPTQPEYDHVLLGNDLGTLYTAALLARNGHQCCVLQLKHSTPYEVCPEGAPCTAPIQHISVGKIERYQGLLDVVQSSQVGERVTFAPIGEERNGYTSSLIRLQHKAHSLLSTSKQGILHLDTTQQVSNKNTSFIHLRVGEHSLAHDLCNSINVNKTLLVAYFLKIKMAVHNLTTYLLSRIVPYSLFESSPIAKSDAYKQFIDLSTVCSDQLIYNSGLDNPDLFEALNSIAVVGAEEALPGEDCSGYALAHALNNSMEGVFYPIGGAQAIANRLIETITKAGGVVYQDIDFKEIDLVEVGAKNIKAVGVKVHCQQSDKEVYFKVSKSIVSGLGVLTTHTKLLPPEAISIHTQEQLSVLTEARPKIKVVYWLNGKQETLQLRSTDYYEVGVQPSRSDAHVQTIEHEHELYADGFIHVWSPSAKDPQWATSINKDVQILIVEFEATQQYLRKTEFHFDSCKDKSLNPNMNDNNNTTTSSSKKGPMIYTSDNPSEVYTNPKHEQYTNTFNTPLSFSKSKKDKLQQRADGVIKTLYPHVMTQIKFVHVQPPVVSGGSSLACTASKFKCNLSSKTDVENFYLTGRDLATNGLAGDLQGGWIAANAILEYQLNELLASRNIIADLNNT